MEEADRNIMVVEEVEITILTHHHQMMNLITISTTMDTLIVAETIIITRRNITTITGTMGTIKSGMRMIIDR